MNYLKGIEYMQSLCSNGGSGVFSPEGASELKIYYPGYKGQGDYRLEIEGENKPPTHKEICKRLHNMLIENQCEFLELKKLLIDIYEQGTDVQAELYSIPEAQKIIFLIYWITLQEEINYPQPKKQGRRMAFSRYFEAIYCTQYECPFNLDDILERCSNKKNFPQKYNLIDPPSFYDGVSKNK